MWKLDGTHTYTCTCSHIHTPLCSDVVLISVWHSYIFAGIQYIIIVNTHDTEGSKLLVKTTVAVLFLQCTDSIAQSNSHALMLAHSICYRARVYLVIYTL